MLPENLLPIDLPCKLISRGRKMLASQSWTFCLLKPPPPSLTCPYFLPPPMIRRLPLTSPALN